MFPTANLKSLALAAFIVIGMLVQCAQPGAGRPDPPVAAALLLPLAGNIPG